MRRRRHLGTLLAMSARRPVVQLALVAAVVLIAAVAAGVPAATATAANRSAPSARTAADRAAQAPEAVLAEVVRTLRKVRSLRYTGTFTDAEGTMHVVADVASARRTRVSVRQGRTRFTIIALPSSAYFLGNAAFWTSSGGEKRKRYAGRWLHATKRNAKTFTSFFPVTGPKLIASCISTNHGTLAVERGSLDGKPVVVIVDRGDKPGTTPNKLYVAASGPALLLRQLQTGPRTPGGEVDARCEDEELPSTASDVRLSRFDRPLKIIAPKRSLRLPDSAMSAR